MVRYSFDTDDFHILHLAGLTGARRKTMSAAQGPFPRSRPEIHIEARPEAPFRIDLREMAWWFIVPETGDRVRYGSYGPASDAEAPWMLTETVSLEACRSAVIHGRACVEIEVEEHHLAAMAGTTRPRKKRAGSSGSGDG